MANDWFKWFYRSSGGSIDTLYFLSRDSNTPSYTLNSRGYVGLSSLLSPGHSLEFPGHRPVYIGPYVARPLIIHECTQVHYNYNY